MFPSANSRILGGNQLDATNKLQRGPLQRARLSQQFGRAELVPRRPILQTLLCPKGQCLCVYSCQKYWNVVEKVSFPNTGVLDDAQHFLSMWHLPSFNVGFTFISDRFGPYPVSAQSSSGYPKLELWMLDFRAFLSYLFLIQLAILSRFGSCPGSLWRSLMKLSNRRDKAHFRPILANWGWDMPLTFMGHHPISPTGFAISRYLMICCVLNSICYPFKGSQNLEPP